MKRSLLIAVPLAAALIVFDAGPAGVSGQSKGQSAPRPTPAINRPAPQQVTRPAPRPSPRPAA